MDTPIATNDCDTLRSLIEDSEGEMDTARDEKEVFEATGTDSNLNIGHQ